jgi:hypothetical protein
MHLKLEDQDMVLLVAVVLILVAIVLVCCKQSFPAALLVVFVIALLALSVDTSKGMLIDNKHEIEAAIRVQKNKKQQAAVMRVDAPVPTKDNRPENNAASASNIESTPPVRVATSFDRGCKSEGCAASLNNTMPNEAAVKEMAALLSDVPPPAAADPNSEPKMLIKDVTTTNVPIMQNNPPVAPKICTVDSAYTQYNPPELSDSQSNTYQTMYVLPVDVSRPKNQSVAEVQAKTFLSCPKKEIGAFPKPDRMRGNDVFLGEDALLQIELNRLEQQEATKSLIIPPSGSSTLNAALDVSPPPFPEYHYVKPLPDNNKEMKQKIRNEGLYGIHGDLNCLQMRRSAVADKGFIQPLGARQEFLRYLAYDMPNYRNQWQTARSNTVNSDTRYFK